MRPREVGLRQPCGKPFVRADCPRLHTAVNMESRTAWDDSALGLVHARVARGVPARASSLATHTRRLVRGRKSRRTQN